MANFQLQKREKHTPQPPSCAAAADLTNTATARKGQNSIKSKITKMIFDLRLKLIDINELPLSTLFQADRWILALTALTTRGKCVCFVMSSRGFG